MKISLKSFVISRLSEKETKERHVMTMKDWINATDDLLKFRRK